MKNKTTALIFSILLDGLGIDRFYFGYTGIGILKLLTGGCFGALYIIDIVFIATGKLLPQTVPLMKMIRERKRQLPMLMTIWISSKNCTKRAPPQMRSMRS